MSAPVAVALAAPDMCVVLTGLLSDPHILIQTAVKAFYPLAVNQSFNLFNRPQSKLIVHVTTI